MTEDLLKDNIADPLAIDPNKKYLEDLVGEGRKFQSPEELARGKYISDVYIKQLESRLDEMREDFKKVRDDNVSRAKLEELIEDLTQRQQLASSDNQKANEDRQPAINPDDIKSLVSSEVQNIASAARRAENFNIVRKKLQEHFGSNYQVHVKQQVEDLGLTSEEFNEIARSNPKVLFRTLGLDAPSPRDNFQPPLPSSQRRDTFAPNTQKRDWDYYEDMRLKNPDLYHDRKTYVQIQKDVLEQGEDAFYGRNK